MWPCAPSRANSTKLKARGEVREGANERRGVSAAFFAPTPHFGGATRFFNPPTPLSLPPLFTHHTLLLNQ
jgi:hypothetical protein